MDRAKRNIKILAVILLLYLILSNLVIDTAWWAQLIVVLLGLSAVMQNYRTLRKAEIQKKKEEIDSNRE
ncbi:hypothetical protein WN59_01210 [Salinicoccus sediminis]|uniref:Uncharacterized protein n=1 Tax=Salinicoccus sediminis TaxID=1432562 RepID=A0A0M2SS61_9STAP|nr:hypothetical protein [Salinicoccus sediminis]KKK35480.1 hypothetical protein WN59_01210 [Salinicoccus sediminis]